MKTSVGRFSNCHLVFDPVVSPVLTVGTSWHSYMWEPDWEPTFCSHMNNNRLWELVLDFIFIFILFWKNQTGFLKEPPSGFEYVNLGFKVPKQQCHLGRRKHYLGLGMLYKKKLKLRFTSPWCFFGSCNVLLLLVVLFFFWSTWHYDFALLFALCSSSRRRFYPKIILAYLKQFKFHFNYPF